MPVISLADAQPGDVVAFDSAGIFGRLIQLGQWLRRADRANRRWHHIAVIVEYVENTPDRGDPANWGCVQASRHVDGAFLDDIANGRPYLVLRCPDGVDRSRVVAQANAFLGTDYGILTIVSIAISMLTPSAWSLSFRSNRTIICSALGAFCLHAGGWLHGWPDWYQVTPADLVGALTAA